MSQAKPKAPRAARSRRATKPMFGVSFANSPSPLPSLFGGRSPRPAQARKLAAIQEVDAGWDDFVAPVALVADKRDEDRKPEVNPAVRLAAIAAAEKASRPEPQVQAVKAPLPVAGKPVVEEPAAPRQKFIAIGSIPPQMEAKPLPSLFSVLDGPKARSQEQRSASKSTIPAILKPAERPRVLKPAMVIEMGAPRTVVPLPPAVVIDDEPQELESAMESAGEVAVALAPTLVIVDEVSDDRAVPLPIDDFVQPVEPVAVAEPVQAPVAAPTAEQQFSRFEAAFFEAGERLAETLGSETVEDFSDLDEGQAPRQSFWKRWGR